MAKGSAEPRAPNDHRELLTALMSMIMARYGSSLTCCIEEGRERGSLQLRVTNNGIQPPVSKDEVILCRRVGPTWGYYWGFDPPCLIARGDEPGRAADYIASVLMVRRRDDEE